VNAPVLFEVGGVSKKGKLPIRFAGTVNVPIVGGNGLTSSVVHDNVHDSKNKTKKGTNDLLKIFIVFRDLYMIIIFFINF
jgi:hypothetical protein